MLEQTTLSIQTQGRGTLDIIARVQNCVSGALEVGLCHLFLHHTSASLILCENADPTVRSDLERWLARAVPDGDALFQHIAEGPDDMPAHVRSILCGADLSIPITNGRLALGTWQGIYLYEHRTAGHARRVTVTVMGGR